MKKRLIHGSHLLFAAPLLSLLFMGVAVMRQPSVPHSTKLPTFHQATALEFSPDGKRLAVFSSDVKTSRVEGQITDAKSGAKLCDLQIPAASLRSNSVGNPAWSPDGKRLIAALFATKPPRESIALWDTGSGKLKNLPYPISGVGASLTDAVRFSADGKTIIGKGVPPAIFDAATGKRLNKPDATVKSYGYSQLSENGQWLASANHQDRILRVRDYKTKKVLWQPKLDSLTGFYWDGDILGVQHDASKADGSSESRLLLWNAKTRRQLPSPPSSVGQQVDDYTFSSDKRTVAFFTRLEPNKSEVVGWDYQANRVLWRTKVTGHIIGPHWSPDGKWLMWQSITNRDYAYRITVLDRNGKPRFKHDYANFVTSWSPDGKQLAYASVTIGKQNAKTLSSSVEIHRF